MIYIKDGVAIIAVNALHRPNRQRFPAPMNSPICASTPSPSWATRHQRAEPRDRKSRPISSTPPSLAPWRMLHELLSTMRIDIDNVDAVESCAKMFRMSKAMLEFRIRNLSNDNSDEKR